MDLLYQRYASPFSFIEGMIQSGRFGEFVVSLWNTSHEEKNEATMWEFFLHRVFEGSFNDFKQGIQNNIEHQNMSEELIETTIQNSMNILNNFNPEKGGDS